jgi:hypothetical protein
VYTADNSIFAISKNNSDVEETAVINISAGEANIRGYYFRLRTLTTVNLNDYINVTDTYLYNLYTNWPVDPETSQPVDSLSMSMYLNVYQDASHHILTYNEVSDNDYTLFQGVKLCICEGRDDSHNDLLLGTFNLSKSNNGFIVNNVVPNENRFTYLNADDIFRYNEDTDEFIGLDDVISQLIIENFTGDLQTNLIIHGEEPDGTYNGETYICITTPTESSKLKLYYNETYNTAGLVLLDGSANDTVLKELFSFANLPAPGTTGSDTISSLTVDCHTTITKGLSVNDIATISGLLNVLNNAIFGGNITAYGNIVLPNGPETSQHTTTTITSNTIKADKVYGAVWG